MKIIKIKNMEVLRFTSKPQFFFVHQRQKEPENFL